MKKTLYRYGMRARGVAPGCQPANFHDWEDGDERYFNYLLYRDELTPQAVKDYELDFIETVEI